MQDVVEKWTKATEELARVFTETYFPLERYGKTTEWLGNEIGGVLDLGYMLFTVEGMKEALELNATFKQIEDYYNLLYQHVLENPDTPPPINFKNFVKQGDTTCRQP